MGRPKGSKNKAKRGKKPVVKAARIQKKKTAKSAKVVAAPVETPRRRGRPPKNIAAAQDVSGVEKTLLRFIELQNKSTIAWASTVTTAVAKGLGEALDSWTQQNAGFLGIREAANGWSISRGDQGTAVFESEEETQEAKVYALARLLDHVTNELWPEGLGEDYDIRIDVASPASVSARSGTAGLRHVVDGGPDNAAADDTSDDVSKEAPTGGAVNAGGEVAPANPS